MKQLGRLQHDRCPCQCRRGSWRVRRPARCGHPMTSTPRSTTVSTISSRSVTRAGLTTSAIQTTFEQSCLQIGFYLASWGMLRGKSFLLNKSERFYERLVQTIVRLGPRSVGCRCGLVHGAEHRPAFGCRRMPFAKPLAPQKRASDTLVTKIMLGVFGNIPAFDTYFCKGLRVWDGQREEACSGWQSFYDCHKAVIDECANTIHTLDFVTGEDTTRHYTKAKIVDMVGFMEGAE